MSRFLFLVLCTGAFLGCGGDEAPSGPPTPTSLTVVSGGQQSSVVGQALAQPIVVRVNAGSAPAVGVSVTFAVTAGGGSVTPTSATTDNAGTATAVWTLGGQLGDQTLSATAASLPAGVVHATGTSGPPALLLPTEGNTQFAVVKRPVATRPKVQLTDAFGNPIAGRTITFTVTSGGGSITDSVQVTDAAGNARLGSWTLGPAAGNQKLVAFLDQTIRAEILAIGTPASLTAIEGDNQTANAGTLVPIRPAVRALDPDGQPLANVPITFRVDAGGGEVTGASQQTDAQGVARVGNWILGQAVGPNQISATTFGIPAASFTATGIAGIAAALDATTPLNVTSLVGNFLPSNPEVRVTDAAGHPVAGVAVVFEVVTGGGTIASAGIGSNFGLLAAAGATSDFDGRASLGAWRLGSTPGDQTVRATAAGLPPLIFTATAEAVPPGEYKIEIRFTGTQPTPGQQAAFDLAAARWQQLIVGDIPDGDATNFPATSCSPALNEIIDDLVIYAELTTIDGAGGVLGSAGPCLIDDVSFFTAVGRMRFDTADLASLETQGLLDRVILHEMTHVIGFGTLWQDLDLLTGAGTGDPYFVGSSARSAFRVAAIGFNFAGNIVPVENTGSAGTRDGHWRESILDRELMTGFVDVGGTNPLSAITVASFRDMGYGVNDEPSDPFTLAAAVRASPAAKVELRETPLAGPIYMMHRGRIVGTRSRIPF